MLKHMSLAAAFLITAGAGLALTGCDKKADKSAQTGAAAPGSGASAAPASDQTGTPGVTATEIKIGQSLPFSGPLSAYAALGKGEAAYFKMINDKGGITGHKL